MPMNRASSSPTLNLAGAGIRDMTIVGHKHGERRVSACIHGLYLRTPGAMRRELLDEARYDILRALLRQSLLDESCRGGVRRHHAIAGVPLTVQYASSSSGSSRSKSQLRGPPSSNPNID